MHSTNVIIIGTTHHNTLGMIRSIGEANVDISCILLLYGEQESYLAQSKYVNHAYYVDSSDEITDLLLSIKKDTKQILITVTDEAAHQLDINTKLLEQYYYFFRSDVIGQLTHYMDKYVQDKIAEKIGIDVPNNYDSDNIQYPCILKPIASLLGGKQFLICNNQNDYTNVLNRHKDVDFQIQQYIKKEKEFVLNGLSVDGEVYIPACILKHREVLGGTTYSTVYPINLLNPDLIHKSKQLIKAIAYEGLFGIEYMLSEGKYYFIEINLRNDATSYSVTKAGVNLPLAYIYAKQNKDYLSILQNQIKTIDSMVEFRDINFVLNKKINLLKWIKQKNLCECLYFYNKEDFKPYLINYKLFRKRFITIVFNKLLKCIGRNK